MRVHTPGITKATIAMATTLGTHPTFISSNGVKYLRSLEYGRIEDLAARMDAGSKKVLFAL